MLTLIQAEAPEQIQLFQELFAEYKAWDLEMSGRIGLDVDTLLDFEADPHAERQRVRPCNWTTHARGREPSRND